MKDSKKELLTILVYPKHYYTTNIRNKVYSLDDRKNFFQNSCEYNLIKEEEVSKFLLRTYIACELFFGVYKYFNYKKALLSLCRMIVFSKLQYWILIFKYSKIVNHLYNDELKK